jgi:hypothetical protein
MICSADEPLDAGDSHAALLLAVNSTMRHDRLTRSFQARTLSLQARSA